MIPGVLDSTTNFIEHPKVVAQRIQVFTDIVGRDRVIAGTDCGFSHLRRVRGGRSGHRLGQAGRPCRGRGDRLRKAVGKGGVTFKQALTGGDLIVGAFVKTPSPIVVEVLGLTDLDCVCLDAEHAPFDRLAIDGCVMAARAARKPVLVRTPSTAPEHILSALDCGATGVVLPHIRSEAEAKAAASAAHYGAGGRGYAGSSRSAILYSQGHGRSSGG